MPDAATPQNVDQSIFEDAIAEVRRLETLRVKRPETAEALAAEPIFEERDSSKVSITDFPQALDAAMRVEHGYRPAPIGAPGAAGAPAPAHSAYEEETRKREQDALHKMQEKFKKLEAEGKAPELPVTKTAAKKVVAASPAQAVTAATVPPAQVAVPAGPKAAANEEERLKIMREKLAGLVKKRQAKVGAAAPAGAAPEAQVAAPEQPSAEAPGPAPQAAGAAELRARLAKKLKEMKEKEGKKPDKPDG